MELRDRYFQSSLEDAYRDLLERGNSLIRISYDDSGEAVNWVLHEQGMLYRELANRIICELEEIEEPGILERIRRKFR